MSLATDAVQKVNTTQYNSTNTYSYKVVMAQSWKESTREMTNYGRFINQFLSNIIRSIRQFNRINNKICRQKISIMFNQIYIYTYIYMLPYPHVVELSSEGSNGNHLHKARLFDELSSW